MYRPRGTLARIIHEKFHNDNFLKNIDTCSWYALYQELQPAYQSKFVPLERPDETTIRWLEQAKIKSSDVWLHLWHAVARSLLQFFMSQTDINGFLKRGSMFILSEPHFKKLLEAGGFKLVYNCDNVTILDIGAGDGEISLRLANTVSSLGENINVRMFATEASWTMRGRLKKLNFNVINDAKQLRNVELISCLNVLDRCVDPFQLLEDMYRALAPEGRIIVALVLPYMHYVETNTSHQPMRLLMRSQNHGRQPSFEEEANLFFELLDNYGFRVEAWTKAPYLCEGDLHQSFYWLIDLIVVLSKKSKKEEKQHF